MRSEKLATCQSMVWGFDSGGSSARRCHDCPRETRLPRWGRRWVFTAIILNRGVCCSQSSQKKQGAIPFVPGLGTTTHVYARQSNLAPACRPLPSTLTGPHAVSFGRKRRRVPSRSGIGEREPPGRFRSGETAHCTKTFSNRGRTPSLQRLVLVLRVLGCQCSSKTQSSETLTTLFTNLNRPVHQGTTAYPTADLQLRRHVAMGLARQQSLPSTRERPLRPSLSTER